MNITELEKQTLEFIGKTGDGQILIKLLERIVTHYADVRNIKEINEVNIRANQLACNIIQDEIISRLNRGVTDTKTEITEEYE